MDANPMTTLPRGLRLMPFDALNISVASSLIALSLTGAGDLFGQRVAWRTTRTEIDEL
jgi:hypothetical protein